MFSPEALTMVGLSAIAVLVAYTKLRCPAEETSLPIAWLPTEQHAPEDAARLQSITWE